MRALYPYDAAMVERNGISVGYEVFGSGSPTIVLLTSWAIVHARQWKAQVPFLARQFRVVTVEGRGNGRADRPGRAEDYSDRAYVDDALAVMDATGTDRAVVVGLSMGARHALQLAAWHPSRAAGVVAIGTALPWTMPPDFDVPKDRYDGWEKANRHYWQADYRGWVEFFMSQVFTEPHSTKHLEDGIGWGMETDAATLLLTAPAVAAPTEWDAEQVCRQVRCPVLVIHGDRDAVVPYETGVAVAEWTSGELVTMSGGGHAPPMREPVRTNLLIRDFAARFAEAPPPRRWRRSLDRPRRVLMVCSPIGLGHARRDLAIAAELRKQRPDIQIDWLAQSPVAEVVASHGERVHPASRWLSSESAHIESEAGEHDLRVFQAIRRMDEILVANFMLFHDVVEDEAYDLWVADEGWDVDHFLHENPELKSSAYAWLTDFVGWLPMPGGGDAEAVLTADYNAEMLEHIARLPRVRDRAIFVGDPQDIVADSFGPDLPPIREWTEQHYDFAGYITGFTPRTDRAALRAELGYDPDERICLVTVGGSGVGRDLLQHAVAAYPTAARAVPGLRMIAVAGPRIDPASVPAPPGVEVVGYLPDLYQHLTACDLAVVHGGLTTTMELTAANRPFIYIPLGNHFEQNIHVRHRLERHRAGLRLDYSHTDPDQLAAAIAGQIDSPVDYQPVPSDGAHRAATLLADLI